MATGRRTEGGKTTTLQWLTMGAKGAKKATGAKSKSNKQTPLCARCSVVCVDAARADGGIAFA